jgi:hypothetical protein
MFGGTERVLRRRKVIDLVCYESDFRTWRMKDSIAADGVIG